MKQINDCAVSELRNRSILALFNEETLEVQLLSCKSPLSFIERTLQKLDSNQYRNRSMQNAWNKGFCGFVLIKNLDDLKSYNPVVQDLLVQLEVKKIWQELQSSGYKPVTLYKALQLTPEIRLEKGSGICIALTTGRYKRYYMQRHFSSIDEANAYLTNTSLTDMVIETEGCESVYRSNT